MATAAKSTKYIQIKTKVIGIFNVPILYRYGFTILWFEKTIKDACIIPIQFIFCYILIIYEIIVLVTIVVNPYYCKYFYYKINNYDPGGSH